MTPPHLPIPQKKKKPQKIPPQKPAKSQKVPNVAIRPCAVVPCRFRTTSKCSQAPAAKRKATKTKRGPQEMHRQAKRRSYVSVPVKYVHRVYPGRTACRHTPFSHKCIRRTS